MNQRDIDILHAMRADLERLKRKLDTASGPGVVNTPYGLTINPPPARRQQPVIGTGSVPRVRVLTNAAGGGKYYGYVVTNPVGVLASGNLAETELAGNSTFTGSDLGVNVAKVLILNGFERGQSTHILTDTTAGPIVTDIFAAVYVGMSADATPLPTYAITGLDPFFCTVGS